MSAQTLTPEQRAERVRKLASIAGLALAGFLFAPFAILTIKGLVSLIVVGVIGLVTVNVGVPWFSYTLANWKLKALKSVAAANPIETLENIYQQRQEALLKIRDSIKEFHSVVQELWSQIQEHNEHYPDRPSQYLEKYNKMKALLELRSQKYKRAQTDLLQFSQLIEEKRSDWKIAQSMARADKLANVGEDFQSKLLKDTALTTVQDSLNFSFSELEVSLLDEQTAPTAIANSGVVTAALPAPKTTVASAPSSLDLDLDGNVQEAEVVAPKRSGRTIRS
jgi:hypothetical protein